MSVGLYEMIWMSNSLVGLHDGGVRGIVGMHKREVAVEGGHHLLGTAVGQITCG
jgi:hypothetical protein